jgi:glycosyltransferase involved in cell wall biosynthesis
VAIYQEHNILLFPSLFEGFGKVFLEGMAAGLCVVGFREGGLPDIAVHGRDALLCDPGDRRTFGQLVSAALQNPDQTEAIGRRAREVGRRFTWDRHARETEDFCWQLKLGTRKQSIAS